MPVLFKCEHSVYGAEKPDGYSAYCCLCTYLKPLTPAEEIYMQFMAQSKTEYREPEIIE